MSSKTRTILISLFIIDVAVAIIFTTLFLHTKSLTSDASLKEEQIKDDIRKEESISVMKKDIGFSKNSEDELSSYLIGKDDSDVTGFIKVLENIASGSQLTIDVQSLSYEQDASLSQVNGELVHISIAVSGKWDNVFSFIKFLINYPLKINIKNLSLGVIDAKSNWSANIDFTAIKLKNN